MHSEAVEDYLKTIYHLQQRETLVTTNQLADYLAIRQSSVTNMLKKLSDMALIVYEPYQGATLTDEGQEIAVRILRYHRLVEQFLYKKLGVPWEEIHAEAEKWEHVLSPSLANRMDTALGYPPTNPHGAPIPKQDGTIDIPPYIELADLEPGQSALISQLNDRDPAFLRYCSEQGLKPGVTITLQTISPYGDLFRIQIDNISIDLGSQAATNILFVNVQDTPYKDTPEK